MAANNPFTPNTAGTATITVSSSSAVTALPKAGMDQQIMVSALAANAVCFIEFGTSSATVVIATGTPILPGSVMIFTVGPTVTSIAVIGTTGTIYVTSGQGA